MAEKKGNNPVFKAHQVEVPENQMVRRKIVDGVARCGNCGCRLVNVEARIKCRFCWYCGKAILWK